MKVFLRILYALAIAILFILFSSLANKVAANKYFDTEGAAAFENNSEDKYRMLYGPTGYHKKEPNYSFVIDDYQIQFFEINKIFTKGKGDDIEVRVDQYLYVLIDHPTKVLTIDNPQRFYMRFKYEDSYTNEDTMTLRIHQFRSLPISAVVDDDDKSLLSKKDLTKRKIVEFEIIDYNHVDDTEVLLVQAPLEIKEEDFTDVEFLKANYMNEEILNNHGIYYQYKADTSKYRKYYFLVMGLFILGIILTTYFLFFFKKKKLGKNKPSEHFNK